jgi:cytochrome b pre-mRNA-processing protein 3
MKLLKRLFGRERAQREALRPLWHRVVAIAREKRWYADLGVADTVGGRFDMIAAVLALVLLRMEREPELIAPSVLLTELFVADMDAQLREAGVGDPVVGKHMGRLVSALGGRLGAYRTALARNEDALAESGNALLAAAVGRNIDLREGAGAEPAAAALRELHGELAAKPAEAILSGEI